MLGGIDRSDRDPFRIECVGQVEEIAAPAGEAVPEDHQRNGADLRRAGDARGSAVRRRRQGDQHRDLLRARSDGPGKGSEFIIRLPILIEPTPGTDPSDHHAGQNPAPSSLRILIVDDNRDSAASLGMVLRIIGNDVQTASDGLEAIRVANELRPDVALIDIGMPGMNGYDAARQLRRYDWGRRIVLIAVTGWGQEGDRTRSMEAGFDLHMVKPVDPRALIGLLSSLEQIKSGQGA